MTITEFQIDGQITLGKHQAEAEELGKKLVYKYFEVLKSQLITSENDEKLKMFTENLDNLIEECYKLGQLQNYYDNCLNENHDGFNKSYFR